MASQFLHTAEVKPIDKPRLQRIGWTMIATTALSFVLIVLYRVRPSPALRWILFAIFLAQGYSIFRVARQVRKLRSVLPPAMESTRLRIAKRHNLLCMAMLFVVLATWIGIAVVHPHHSSTLWVVLAATVLVEGYGMFRIVQHDNALCRRLGFLCPLCRHPLYQARSTIYLTGLCPKCKRNIVAKLPSAVLSSSFDSGNIHPVLP